jgi:hypothetical protein
MKYPQAADHYLDSIHGRALLKMGFIVAPSCNDCHGVHDIKRGVDRDSPIHHANVAKTCGKCHVGIEEIYNQSVHGQMLSQGDRRAGLHGLPHARMKWRSRKTATSKWPATSAAANATKDRLNIIATPITARPWPSANPMSPPMSPPATTATATTTCSPQDPRRGSPKANILATCQQCHPKATAGFTGYRPHANPLDRENYPMLNWCSSS